MKLFREQYKKKTSSSILINFECGLADGWLSKRNVRVYTKAECAKDHWHGDPDNSRHAIIERLSRICALFSKAVVTSHRYPAMQDGLSASLPVTTVHQNLEPLCTVNHLLSLDSLLLPLVSKRKQKFEALPFQILWSICWGNFCLHSFCSRTDLKEWLPSGQITKFFYGS